MGEIEIFIDDSETGRNGFFDEVVLLGCSNGSPYQMELTYGYPLFSTH